ncbi:unnamed protein product [Cuscuta epithymum]|uniref:Secreted protein n=1 Tax=Cuscuta epithymum TaxID=186058 RepID=A0AAV0CYY4_9ASTE|nr:unnamed protein product [Cuscuta epithymum]
MKRVSMKMLAFFLGLFVLASLLGKGLIEAQISAGTNKEQLIVSGQVCNSHDDCKSNAANNGRHFCIKDVAGSETGHCVGFDPAIETELKKKKPKKGGCGYCDTDDDCTGCPAAASCEKFGLSTGFCS